MKAVQAGFTRHRMRIASFSDVHLGPCARRDRFRHDEASLLGFSTHLLETHDRVVLVGDVFQADWGRRVGPMVDVVSEILERYPRLWRTWASPRFVLLRGNHDDVTGRCLSATELWVTEADGIRVLYLHGDQYDATLGGIGPHLTMWLVGRMRARGFTRAADFVEDQLLQRANDLLNRGDPIARVAPELAAEHGVQVIVAGHTHWTACEHLGSVLYANAGVTAASPYHYVSVDTACRSVSLCSFDTESGTSATHRQLSIA